MRYLIYNQRFSDRSVEYVVSYFKPITIKKNAVLLSKGEVSSKLYFINKRCIRTFYLTAQGQEKTRLIAIEGQLAGSLNSFISGRPSLEFVATLEDAELLYITRSRFYKLVKDVPEWEKFYLKLLGSAYIYQNKKIGEMVTLAAGERYNLLIKENPEYIKRLSNKILASYLDITQETLSRLKSK
ncbi:MAG TPA: Crp/Fnr family transcriptional regulator [Mucilaginibacter sp.]|nr:Crp/Fnr family transcriptional regulator [Mucilaginibacter sp.]